MGCVYVWTNTVNGKQYVGKSIEPEVRRRSHITSVRTGCGGHFYNAIRKHGIDAFTYEEVFWSDNDAELKAREIEEIAQRGTFKDSSKGYNLTPGGDGITDLTPESKAKKAASQKIANMKPEVRARRSASSARNMARPEVKAKQIASIKETLSQPGAREKRSAEVKKVLADPAKYAARCRQLDAVRQSPEEFARQTRELWADPEFRARTSAAIKEARTPESYQRSGAKMKQKWADPAYREKMFVAQKVGRQCAVCDGTYSRAAKQSMSKAEVREKIRTSVIAHWTPERCDEQRDLVLNNEKLIRSRKAAQARDHFDPVWVAKQGGRPVCIDNRYFPSAGLADKLLELKPQVARWRCDSTSEKWSGWRYFTTRAGNPECDAVEECWAVMQWAKTADNVNAPAWARPDRPKHGPAPAWAKRAAA